MTENGTEDWEVSRWKYVLVLDSLDGKIKLKKKIKLKPQVSISQRVHGQPFILIFSKKRKNKCKRVDQVQLTGVRLLRTERQPKLRFGEGL